MSSRLLGVWVVLFFRTPMPVLTVHGSSLLTQQHNIHRMSWPTMSPDLFPTEHVWDMTEIRVCEYQKTADHVSWTYALQKYNTLPQRATGKIIRNVSSTEWMFDKSWRYHPLLITKTVNFQISLLTPFVLQCLWWS